MNSFFTSQSRLENPTLYHVLQTQFEGKTQGKTQIDAKTGKPSTPKRKNEAEPTDDESMESPTSR